MTDTLADIMYRLSPDALSDLDTIEICPGMFTGSFRTGDLLLELGLIEVGYSGPAGFMGLSKCRISELGREVLTHGQGS